MWGLAFFVLLELGIALPDHTTVFAVGVPHLRSINLTTVTADELAGKDGSSSLTIIAHLSSFQLCLYQLPLVGIYYGRMAICHVVLWHLPFIYLHLLT